MGQHAAPQEVAAGQQRPALLGRDPLQASAQPRMERHVAVRLQQERIEKRLAELAVAGPGLARDVRRERSDVDEGGTRAAPLDVEGGRVLEGHLFVERRTRHVELEQGGVLEHAERPLVRVRNHGHPFVLEDRHPAGRERRQRRGVGDLTRRHQAAIGHEPGVKAGRGEPLPVLEGPGRQAAVCRSVVMKDPGVRIAERACVEPYGWLSITHLLLNEPMTGHRYLRRRLAALSVWDAGFSGGQPSCDASRASR